MTATIVSTDFAQGGGTSQTVSSVTVPDGSTLIVFTAIVDGTADWDGEDVVFNSVSITFLASADLVGSRHASAWFYENTSGSDITDDVVVDWGGDSVSGSAVYAVVVRNLDTFVRNNELWVANSDAPSNSIAATGRSLVFFVTVESPDTDGETEWDGTELEHATDMGGIYEGKLSLKTTTSHATVSFTGSVTGSPGTKDHAMFESVWTSIHAPARLINGGLVR